MTYVYMYSLLDKIKADSEKTKPFFIIAINYCQFPLALIISYNFLKSEYIETPPTKKKDFLEISFSLIWCPYLGLVIC